MVVVDLMTGEGRHVADGDGVVEEEGGEEGVSSSSEVRRGLHKERGVCNYSRCGKWLYCLQGRTLVKRDASTMEVVLR